MFIKQSIAFKNISYQNACYLAFDKENVECVNINFVNMKTREGNSEGKI